MHVGNIFRVFGSKNMKQMGRYIDRNHVGASIMLIGLLCITAMPPSGLFMSELMVFKALVTNKYWFVLALTVILLCTIVWAICRDILAVLFLPSKEPLVLKEPTQEFPVAEKFWQFALLCLSIWWGLWTPDCITNLINSAAEF